MQEARKDDHIGPSWLKILETHEIFISREYMIAQFSFYWALGEDDESQHIMW